MWSALGFVTEQREREWSVSLGRKRSALRADIRQVAHGWELSQHWQVAVQQITNYLQIISTEYSFVWEEISPGGARTELVREGKADVADVLETSGGHHDYKQAGRNIEKAPLLIFPFLYSLKNSLLCDKKNLV